MHKLNDYRSLCLYELQDYFYKLLGDLFTYIIDIDSSLTVFVCVFHLYIFIFIYLLNIFVSKN